jgi:hypothetical protein
MDVPLTASRSSESHQGKSKPRAAASAVRPKTKRKNYSTTRPIDERKGKKWNTNRRRKNANALIKKQQDKQHNEAALKKTNLEDTMFRISYEELDALPVISWTGSTRVLNTYHEMHAAVQEILISGEKHLGFDTEPRPNFIKGRPQNAVALAQLATANTVYLFRICRLKGHCIEMLLPILTDHTVLKTGIAIDEDI